MVTPRCLRIHVPPRIEGFPALSSRVGRAEPPVLVGPSAQVPRSADHTPQAIYGAETGGVKRNSMRSVQCVSELAALLSAAAPALRRTPDYVRSEATFLSTRSRSPRHGHQPVSPPPSGCRVSQVSEPDRGRRTFHPRRASHRPQETATIRQARMRPTARRRSSSPNYSVVRKAARTV